MFLLLVTATIKSMKPTEQDLLEERNRMTKTIQNNNEINVYSERELALVQEIIDIENKEIVDIPKNTRYNKHLGVSINL